MGLTHSSVALGAKNTDEGFAKENGTILVALAGNPNVGKSTLFNALTKLHQHTGNWPGKTVGSAYGTCSHNGQNYIFADIPGTYSLFARSAEEELARDALLYGECDAVAVVCDATCLQRNLNLVLQLREICGRLIVCVNLLDEAKRKGIHIDLEVLERCLGLPVIGMSAGKGDGIEQLFDAVEKLNPRRASPVCLGCELNDALKPLTDYFSAYQPPLPPQWLAARLCEGDKSMIESMEKHLGMDRNDPELCSALKCTEDALAGIGIGFGDIEDICAEKLNKIAENIFEEAVSKETKANRQLQLDRLLTQPVFGGLLMLMLLAAVLWLTIAGANYPSALLSHLLFSMGERAKAALLDTRLPQFLVLMLMDGVYKTCAWVTAVMLPPMAIFFPLFTLMEDLGLLPRIAFNMDPLFKGCGACGKQSLTMCMGFGCNAAGVVGCRIIDSPRERLIAIITNSFVPCNGRFPTMIALISIFFAGSGALSSLYGALMLTALVLLGIAGSLAASKLLSVTLLRGLPSSFTLELPPYRMPKFGELIVRSVLDRTVFVLGRALTAAAPAGLLIWILGNLDIRSVSLLEHFRRALEPFGSFIGLDGAVLLAFIVGIPANEIVVPVMLMCYLSGSSLMDYGSLSQLQNILTDNGWTLSTALCALIFSLMHWPCATTLMTIKKESGSLKYTLLAAALPTVFGIILCAAINCVLN